MIKVSSSSIWYFLFTCSFHVPMYPITLGALSGLWYNFFLCKMIMADNEREHRTLSPRKNRLFTPIRQDSSRADRCVKSFKSPNQIQSFLPHDRTEIRTKTQADVTSRERREMYLYFFVFLNKQKIISHKSISF